MKKYITILIITISLLPSLAQDYRPSSLHFTPPQGWMNDPNGLVYLDGQYHLFYQHNPDTIVWAPMHWGHATSTDLIHWRHQPIALYPDSIGMIFSGSCVVDKHNTAGFGHNAIVAIYTVASTTQAQAIAYSTDGGQTFSKYNQGRPILTADCPDFRDPKVFWYEKDEKWIMLLAAGGEIQFYASKNLKEWEKISSFGYGYGNHQGVWECPDMFLLDDKWVLIVSVNPGGVWGGSATQYFVGNFDGKRFIADDHIGSQRWMDYGKDHYATVTYNNAPNNRRIAITWLNNWEYATAIPATTFRSCMAIPTELSIQKDNDDYRLIVKPISEIDKLKKRVDSIDDAKNCAYEIDIVVEPNDQKRSIITLQNRKNEKVTFEYDFANRTFSMDRTQSGITDFAPSFKAITKASINKCEQQRIRIIVDRQSIEIFDSNGQFCMTNLVFPTEPYSVITTTGENISYSIYNLQ